MYSSDVGSDSEAVYGLINPFTRLMVMDPVMVALAIVQTNNKVFTGHWWYHEKVQERVRERERDRDNRQIHGQRKQRRTVRSEI